MFNKVYSGGNSAFFKDDFTLLKCLLLLVLTQQFIFFIWKMLKDGLRLEISFIYRKNAH